jgi:hypothetical protein
LAKSDFAATAGFWAIADATRPNQQAAKTAEDRSVHMD